MMSLICALKTIFMVLLVVCLISFGYASPVGAIASLERQLLLQGFHRELVTSVSVAFKEGQKKPCRMALVEEFPSGMYLDLDQLESIQGWEDYQVMPQKTFDVEKPEHRSEPVSVVIYKRLQKISNKELNATVKLPLHLRYHMPGDEDFIKVNLPNPQVLIRCEDSGDEEHTVKLACDRKSANLCKWHKVTVRSKNKSIAAEIPVGKTKHYPLVLIGTQVVSIASMILLAQLMAKRNNGFYEFKIK